MNRTIRSLALVALTGLISSTALSQSNTVKLGVIYYQTHARTTGITGLGVLPGADAEVGNATTLLTTYERELAPNIGIEMVLGVPPKIIATGGGSMAFLGEVLSAKNVAPTVLVNYHFGAAGSTWRPYLGLGINYTHFVEARTPYGWDVNLSDSWGLAAQAGVDYAINRQWGLFASVAVLKVKSDLVAAGAVVLQTTIDFRPVTYAAGVSYKF